MSEKMSKRVHREMSLVDKISLIKASESTPKPTHVFLSTKFGIGRSTVGEILKKKKLYEEQWKKNIHSKRCRILKSSNADVINEKLYLYYNQAKLKKLPVSGPILQHKALDMAKELGVNNFKASNGWLDSWKKRFNIRKFKCSQEATHLADTETSVLDGYKFRLHSMTSGFTPENIFNCDEIGIFFRALPDKLFEKNGKLVRNGELMKERLTILLCCSSTGEKLKPLVIGGANLSRVCKEVEVEKLPVQWRSNRKAWMETSHFLEWLQDLNQQMQRQERKIILFMDSVSSHLASDATLSNVTIMLIPASSCLQPLEAGIQEDFKANYRKRLLTYLITQQYLSTGASRHVTVLHAISWVAGAWKEVTPSLICKSFSQCGFNVEPPASTDEASNDGLQQMLDIAAFSGIQVDLSAKEFVSVDDDLQTESLDILSDGKDDPFKCESQMVMEEDEPEVHLPSHLDALHHLNKLDLYFGSKDHKACNLIDLLTQMVSKNFLFEKQCLIQSVINGLYTS